MAAGDLGQVCGHVTGRQHEGSEDSDKPVVHMGAKPKAEARGKGQNGRWSPGSLEGRTVCGLRAGPRHMSYVASGNFSAQCKFRTLRRPVSWGWVRTKSGTYVSHVADSRGRSSVRPS